MLKLSLRSLWQGKATSHICGAAVFTPRNSDEGYSAQWVRGGSGSK
jgi:hypothetical protein